MARALVLVVSRAVPARYAYFRHIFASDTVEVIVDRRRLERRNGARPVGVERRRSDRRVRATTADLEKFGWAIVRH